MTRLLVGGISSLHDPLCAAALRGLGLDAVPLYPRTDRGLRRARSLGNHGQCNPAHYAVGAVIEQARASGASPDEFAREHEWLTVGSCGPCRLAAFGFEYARVLDGAGLGALPIRVVEQLAFAGTDGAREPLGAPASEALLRAVVAGDVLAAVGHRLRPWASDPDVVDELLATWRDELARAFESQADPVLVLLALAVAENDVVFDLGRALPRVLLVGEPWTTLADGDPSYDLARRLEIHGAEVAVPTATDWLCFRLWEERGIAAGLRLAATGAGGQRDPFRVPFLEEVRAAGAEVEGQGRLAALRRADLRVRALWRLYARAAGLRGPRPVEPEELAALASPHYDPAVRGGSAHLELGRALAVARDRAAHLVLSLKPFGCLPSSAISDGIVSVLLRRQRGPAFLAIETTGDADAAVESRIDMALHAAALQAAAEFDDACARRGLATSEARSQLRLLPLSAVSLAGPRVYPCTAAELLRRADPRASRDSNPQERESPCAS